MIKKRKLAITLEILVYIIAIPLFAYLYEKKYANYFPTVALTTSYLAGTFFRWYLIFAPFLIVLILFTKYASYKRPITNAITKKLNKFMIIGLIISALGILGAISPIFIDPDLIFLGVGYFIELLSFAVIFIGIIFYIAGVRYRNK